MVKRSSRLIGALAVALALAGCGGFPGSGVFSGASGAGGRPAQAARPSEPVIDDRAQGRRRSTIWDLFDRGRDPGTEVAVNKYLWNASLEVLSFMPVEAADPFTGTIVFGWGTPPGGRRAYRATVVIEDPALDARSLRLALLTRAGPADRATIRALEDAILTRARQLRVRDSRL